MSLTCIRAFSCCCLAAAEQLSAAVNAGTAEAGRKARSRRSLLAEPSCRLRRWQLCCACLAAGVSFSGSRAAAACSRSHGAVTRRRSCALLACSSLSEVPSAAPAKACSHKSGRRLEQAILTPYTGLFLAKDAATAVYVG